MTSKRSRLILVLIVVLGSCSSVLAQATFDPHDLSGFWTRNKGFRGVRGTKLTDVPAMTPEGEKRLNANIPARGRNKGEPLNGEHPGYVRAVIPALSNDPLMRCDADGFPRLLLDPEATEWIMTSGRILQLFQRAGVTRQIWMDGRQLPTGENLDNAGGSWFGMSVGKWEGDTLVVNTVGFNERTWLDIYGFPHSSEMRLEERYRRIDKDNVEWTFTIYDPKIYREPWVSDKKNFKRMTDKEVTFFGWKGFSGPFEGYCSHDEEEEFNKRVRDPAGVGSGK